MNRLLLALAEVLVIISIVTGLSVIVACILLIILLAGG